MAARSTTPAKKVPAKKAAPVATRTRATAVRTPAKAAPAKTAPAKRVVRTRKSTAENVATVGGAPVVDVNLHAYVPDKSVSERYINRKVNGVWDADILGIAMRTKRNVMLMGETGAGKTMFGEAYASKHGLNYYSLPCDVSIDPSAFFGKMVPTEEAGKFEWVDGPVTQLVRHGGVLNFSEINFLPPKIAASIYPLLDARRYVPLLAHHGEIVRAHPNLVIIADFNPQYRGTMELNAAFKNRFPIKIQWDYSDEVEEKLVNLPTLRIIANKLRQQVGTEINTPVSTNMLMEFEQFALDAALGLDFAIGNMVTSFDVAEREAVKNVVNLSAADLRNELKVLIRRNSGVEEKDEELEDIEFTFEAN